MNVYCVTLFIFFIYNSKNLIIILLESASTGFKQCHIFTSLGSGHFKGVIQYTNTVINLWHQPNIVLTAYKYYSLISFTFCYKCTIFMEHKMSGSKPTASIIYMVLPCVVSLLLMSIMYKSTTGRGF